MIILIFNEFIFYMKKYMCSILEKLTELINRIIDGNEEEIFSVLDNGTGIKEEINNIFKRFYRGNNVSTKNEIGIGFYLSIEIISKQNGFIRVNSMENGGSTFSFLISQ